MNDWEKFEMKLSKDDPRITAYALGEIENDKERAEIEQAVAESEELQQAVREIREMGKLLAGSLAAEPAPELSEFDKARMEQRKPETETPSLMGKLLNWPALSALTAAAAVALLVFVLVPPYGARDNGVPDIEQLPTSQMVPAGKPAPPEEREPQISQLEMELPVDELKRVEGRESNEYIVNLGPREERADRDKVQTAPTLAQTEAPAPPPVSMPMPAPETRGQVMSDMAAAAPEAEAVYSLQAFAVTGPEKAGYIRQRTEAWNTESYDTIEETGFRSPLVAPLSTFSIDVDTASYANVRRFLNEGHLPPADAVRIEELINYFKYTDTPPAKALDEGGDPFAVHLAQTDAPWNADHRLLRIALKGYEMPWEERPASNLVFLLDVSGSMNQANKLPLVKDAMDLLVRRLDSRDRVAIVVYAGASGLVLPSTTANNHETIAHAIDNLAAGGSTNAGAGIQLAYKVAREHFIKGGNNRVILCTDGDFNVGLTNRGELAGIAGKEAEDGVSLTILGFGMGNYKDDMLEELSNKGKGSYAYIDSDAEARKVFLQDLASNIFKIAKDVKIQVEFNPAQVKAYRLIGYENRRLNAEDFNDDKKKAGDIGPGHTVVALYEIIPAGVEADLPAVDDLRYQAQPEAGGKSGELATVKLRYKQPDGDTSKLISRTVGSGDLVAFNQASADLQFTAAVAAFGMKLRESEFAGKISWQEIERVASGALGNDPGGHRSEFTGLVRKAEKLSGDSGKADPVTLPAPVPDRG